jgi:hypothetical protein
LATLARDRVFFAARFDFGASSKLIQPPSLHPSKENRPDLSIRPAF